MINDEKPREGAQVPAPAKRPYRHRTGLYSFARVLFGILSPLLFPLRFHGREHLLSAQAPFMLVSNHTSFLDPIALALALPEKQIHFLGKNELNAGGLFSAVLRNLNMISVSRHATDMAAIRACNEVLKAGDVLGLFPEGTRNREENFMKSVENGLSMIALRNRVPVVPAYIHRKVRLFRPTHIYFLPAIPYDDLLDRGMGKDSVDELTRRFVDTMQGARSAAQLKPGA